MSKNAPTSEANERVQRLKAQLAQNHQALKAARHGSRFAKPNTDSEARQIEAAKQAVISAKAALRVGVGSETNLSRAQEDLKVVSEGVRRAKAEAYEEGSILEAERVLLKKHLAEAVAELERETAEALRPATSRWLEALAAFVEANDALHAAELTTEATGATPVVRAARELIIDTTSRRTHVLNLLRDQGWSAYYAADVAQHRALANRTHFLKREHEAAAEAAARQADRYMKARTPLAPAATQPRRRGFSLGSSRVLQK